MMYVEVERVRTRTQPARITHQLGGSTSRVASVAGTGHKVSDDMGDSAMRLIAPKSRWN